MDNFERSIELARQVGKLRGAIVSCLNIYGDAIPSVVCRNLQRVVDETEGGLIDLPDTEEYEESAGYTG